MKIGIETTRLAFMIALLAGCTTHDNHLIKSDNESIARELNIRVIDCALPFLIDQALEKADVSYRYQGGAITFRTDNPALSAHLEQCASPSRGPDGAFEREIEIWSTTKD